MPARGLFHVKACDSGASVSARLEDLRERHGLSERQCEQLAALLRGLAADERAPTAVRDPARAVDVHLADSLAALELDVLRAARKDRGPGQRRRVSLGWRWRSRCRRARSRWWRRRRASAPSSRDSALLAQIANARVVCARVGAVDSREWRRNDVVLARALAAQAVVVEYAAPLLRVGGTLVDWRGRRNAAQERAGSAPPPSLGLELVEIRHVEPYAGARDHHLHVYRKVRDDAGGIPAPGGDGPKRPLARREDAASSATGRRSDRDRR